MNLIAAFDYETKGSLHLRTQALAHSQIYTVNSKYMTAAKIKTIGALKLR